MELPARQHNELELIGGCLTERFGLAGLFGIDFLLAGDELWTLEVNPRYTASVEVLERSLGIRAIELHVAACRGGVLPANVCSNAPTAFVGKAIVFARTAIRVSDAAFAHWMDPLPAPSPAWLADIPCCGASIESGRPVLTVFSEGETFAEAQADLRRRATDAWEQLVRHSDVST
jgi:predicted ATP-grasp superfamily ATP-dependent carboligase